MPYRKKYAKKSKPANGAYSQYSGYLDKASQALSIAYAVKKLVNVEYRSITTAFTTDPNSSGAVVNLTAIAQGDDIANRQGNKIRLKHISCRGRVGINSSATQSRLRMMIVRDNNGSTTQPAITDLFTDVTTFRNNQNKLGDPQSNSRFSILFDKYVLVDAIKQDQMSFNWSMSLDHHVFYTGTAATDEGKGNLYLFSASSEATNDPVVTIDAMIKFIDN